MASNRPYNKEQLIDRFWAGETSLDEERWLKQYFEFRDNSDSPDNDHLYFEVLREKPPVLLDESFDQAILAQLETAPRQGGGTVFNLFGNWRIAAAILVIVGLGMWGIWSNSETGIVAEKPTLNDPEVKHAYEQTRNALFLVSSKFNKAEKQATELKKFNLAKESIKKEQP